MSILTEIFGLLNPIKEWFEAIKRHRREREEDFRDAIGALYIALNETRIYIGILSRPPYHQHTHIALKQRRLDPSREVIDLFSGEGSMFRDRRMDETEATLSRLWTQAGLKLRNINPDLARRCTLKGNYWACPEEWDNKEILKARIHLDKIFREAQKLMTAD